MEVNGRLKENNEKQLEAIEVLNKELKDQKQTHMEANARLKEKNEKQLEAIGVLNKELKDQKETHMDDLSKQVRTKTI